jgi:predicted thioesterase
MSEVEKNYNETFVVTEESCISEIDSALPDLLGTYILVKWMEIICAKNINRNLNKKYITVGKEISIDHIGMVKKGEKVEIISKIIVEESKYAVFSLEAISNQKIIATASHKRILIPLKVMDKIFVKDKHE